MAKYRTKSGGPLNRATIYNDEGLFINNEWYMTMAIFINNYTSLSHTTIRKHMQNRQIINNDKIATAIVKVYQNILIKKNLAEKLSALIDKISKEELEQGQHIRVLKRKERYNINMQRSPSPDGREESNVYNQNKHKGTRLKSTIEIRNYYSREDGYSLERKRELRRKADKYLRENGIV